MREWCGVGARSAVLHVRQVGGILAQRRTDGWIRGAHIMLAFCVFVSVALTACRGTQLALPGGTYRSDAFHFSVNYPAGWQANVSPAASASQGIPLHVIITRTVSSQTNSSLVSNCSITVLNPRDSNIAPQLKLLQDRIQNKVRDLPPLHTVTLGGKPGYQEEPVRQEIPGTQLSDTHTNYYLLLSDYAYEISTDAISSDHVDAELQSMVASFTIVK